MKWWTSEHTFNEPWETVTQAAFRKYPNPCNKSILGVDVVDRKVENGVLKSHKLLTTDCVIPSWVAKIIGMTTCHVSEHSEVDPKNKVMKLRSRNCTLVNLVSVDEAMEYKADPSDPKNKTILTKTNIIAIQGIPMSDYLEGKMKQTMADKAQQGIDAMDWIINKVKDEAQEFSNKFRDEAQDFTRVAQESSLKIGKAAEKEMSELQRKGIQLANDSRSRSSSL